MRRSIQFSPEPEFFRAGENIHPGLLQYVHTYIHTDRHTDRQTYRASDEAGPRGAFAPKNVWDLKKKDCINIFGKTKTYMRPRYVC